jgi:hypothetical protein
MTVGKGNLPGEHLITLDVVSRPASYSTTGTGPWKEAVRKAVASSGVELGLLPTARFAVGLQFRTPAPKNANEVWDLDNLIKPTLDAMEGVFGLRPWAGLPQPADDRVDYLTASKRTVAGDEPAGAVITVHVLAG